MPKDFRDRLRDFLGAQRMSARELSLAAELNPDEVGRILENPRRRPRLDTMFKLCRVTGWRVEDAIYWAIGEEPPTAPAGEPEQIIAVQLMRLGLTEARRAILLAWLREMRPVPDEVLLGVPG